MADDKPTISSSSIFATAKKTSLSHVGTQRADKVVMTCSTCGAPRRDADDGLICAACGTPLRERDGG